MSEIIQSKTVEEKYEMLTDIQHVLMRRNMYVGDDNTVLEEMYLYKPSENKIVLVKDVLFNAALLKFFDEVITNSIDESRRKTRLFDITKIDVVVNKDGFISVKDNGGIPVEIHKKYKMYIPQMIFGVLRTSTNYQQDMTRDGAGLNGLGSKLTNIFSKRFRVNTCDGKNRCVIEWRNNMQELYMAPSITKDNEHGTEVSFMLDLDKFDMKELPQSMIRVFQKRCIDGAAGNPGLEITFSSDMFDGKLDSSWNFNKFEEYVKLYLDENQSRDAVEYYNMLNPSNKYILVPSTDKGNNNVCFVNGAMCSHEDGTHIKKVRTQVANAILTDLAKKDITLVTPRDINSKYMLFMTCNVPNPVYDAQIKNKLVSVIDKNALVLHKDFIAKILSSEIYKIVMDYYESKYKAEEKKNLRKLNSLLKQTKSKKLIDCLSGKSEERELWLFEGDSAGKPMRNFRNPQTQAAYLLRGKVLNTFSLSKSQILENLEWREITAALGLEFNNPNGNVKNCKFKKIVITTDMDFDGHHICGLIIAFFARNFPELFRAGYVFRALSPVVTATKKGQEKRYYHYLSDYERDDKAGLLKGYDVHYAKGLGSLEDDDYKEMLQNKQLIQFSLDNEEDMKMIEIWFQKETEQRKQLLMYDGLSGEVENV